LKCSLISFGTFRGVVPPAPSPIRSMLCPMVRLKLMIMSALGRLILYALHLRLMISLSNSSAVDAGQGATKATSRAKAANAAYGLFEFFHNHDLGSVNLGASKVSTAIPQRSPARLKHASKSLLTLSTINCATLSPSSTLKSTSLKLKSSTFSGPR